MRKLLRAERGSVAVEFSLMLPIFLLILAGIIELGQYYWEQHVLSAAAREGARAASMSQGADINGVVMNYVNNCGGLNVTGVAVNRTTEPLPGDPASTLEVVTVTKPYSFHMLPRLIASWMENVTIIGRAKMIKEI